MDSRLFQEAIRSATVTYPIPFLFGILLLFAVLTLGGSIVVSDWLRILFAMVGTASFLSAIVLILYAVRSRPDLLRSEQHVLRMTMAHMIGDRDMDAATRERLGLMIVDPEDRPGPKNAQNGRDAQDENNNDE
jgi:hypothetical protein